MPSRKWWMWIRSCVTYSRKWRKSAKTLAATYDASVEIAKRSRLGWGGFRWFLWWLGSRDSDCDISRRTLMCFKPDDNTVVGSTFHKPQQFEPVVYSVPLLVRGSEFEPPSVVVLCAYDYKTRNLLYSFRSLLAHSMLPIFLSLSSSRSRLRNGFIVALNFPLFLE